MKFTFECPYCSQRISATDSDSGKQASCPSCNNCLTVPVIAAPHTRAQVIPTGYNRSTQNKLIFTIVALVLVAATSASIFLSDLPYKHAEEAFRSEKDLQNDLPSLFPRDLSRYSHERIENLDVLEVTPMDKSGQRIAVDSVYKAWFVTTTRGIKCRLGIIVAHNSEQGWFCLGREYASGEYAQ